MPTRSQQSNHLRDKNSLPEITDAVYAMVREVKIKLEIKWLLRKERKVKENKRVKKMERQVKELRQLVVRAGNEIYRRKYWIEATHKEK